MIMGRTSPANHLTDGTANSGGAALSFFGPAVQSQRRAATRTLAGIVTRNRGVL